MVKADDVEYYPDSLMFHGSLMNIMGTKFEMLIIGKDRLESELIWQSVVSELVRLDNMLNRFDRTSEVSRVNREAPHQFTRVSEEMWDVLLLCKEYHSRSLGLFDVTLNDFSRVSFDAGNCSIAFSGGELHLDFGGFAKGYALTKVESIVRDGGVRCGYIDFGNSSILGIGHHPYGDAWKVSIENPYNREEILDEITLKDQSLSVSGNTPTYSGHIVRPASGRFVRKPKMVSVVTGNPLDSEILSTAIMVARAGEKRDVIDNFNVYYFMEYHLQ